MRVIELAGAVGSGKSTLAPQLTRLLIEAGVDAIGQSDALAEVAGPRIRLTVDVPGGAAFAVRHPRLVMLVARQLLGAAIDWSHRRRIMGLVLRLGARRRFLDARLREGRVVVVDEGFVQRMVNVFAWRRGAISTRAIERYLRLAPIAETVVVVRADPAVATARARARGLPIRVEAKPAADAARFLERAGEVIDRAVPLLTARGVRLVEVDNSGAMDRALEALRPLASGGPDLPRVTTPVARLGFTLPRPRRVRKPVAGLREGPALGVVMEALDIGAWRAVRALGRATGRSGSVLVETPAGSLVVKRYKPTVEIEQVRVEHAILAELEERGFPAPRLLRTPQGETIVEADDAVFAAFCHVGGYRRSDDVLVLPPRAGQRERLHGATLGALHAALDGFVPRGVSPHGLVSVDGGRTRDLEWHLDLVERVERDPGLDPSVRDQLTEVRATLPALEAELNAAGFRRGVVHGDFGPYNLLVRDGAPILVVDFELARFDWRVVDLATALPRYGPGAGPRAERRMRGFLDGYRSMIDLAPGDVAAIPAVLAFLSLRRAVVCLARWQESRRPAFRAEATQKLALARTTRRPDQPIARVSTAE